MKYDVTKIQEFSEQLAKWRKDRGITLEGQREGFVNNMLEELEEYSKALRLNDEREQIDALCDMCVVWLNCEHKILKENEEFRDTTEYWNKYGALTLCFDCLDTNYSYFISEIFGLMFYKGYNPYIAMQETIKELNSRDGWWVESKNKFIKDKGAYTQEEAIQKFIEEYEIEDFDESKLIIKYATSLTGRLFTFEYEHIKTQYVRWYKADYEKARL